MSKKSIWISIIAVTTILVLCFLSLIFLLAYQETYQMTNGLRFNEVIKGSSEKIAIVNIDGVISSQASTDLFSSTEKSMLDKVIEKLEAVNLNSQIKGVVLQINSPGGEVYATKMIYNKLAELKANNKIIVVQMQDTTASGGYFISALANHIVASEMTLTGSIGVVFRGISYEGLYEKIGIKEYNIANSEGELKVLEDLDNPESDSYKVLQSVADDIQNLFVKVVVEGRGIAEEKVKDFADARVFSGKQALEVGLVDSLGEDEQALEVAKELTNIENPTIIRFEEEEQSFGNILINVLSDILPAIKNSQPEAGLTANYLLYY